MSDLGTTTQRQLERQEQLNQQRLRCELDDRTAR